ncbi:hypothetical protein GCM10010168_91990 [Actinoplanes ianthinogenes]|uniref:Uncharacterized protein n=1 Tax=Actinoplanes ianthinogenes TaxID=122358 RepID=A0ABM7LNC3_9ACTN|nr:hypothetical protein Aiant_14340 [Actinoplanes ianthinogenes]GGR58642.1 hypothetical protein GCM10010168_91990 [Actinoplanes ianthinogenes]
MPAERRQQEVRQAGEAQAQDDGRTFPPDGPEGAREPRCQDEHRGGEPEERGVDRGQAGGADASDGQRERCPEQDGSGEGGECLLALHEVFLLVEAGSSQG